MLTRQDIYNRVKKHLLEQNAVAMHDSGNCAYLGDGGKKCAIGCMIPADKYEPRFEGLPFTGDEIRPVLEEVMGRPMDDDDNTLFTALMYCHDNIKVSVWDKELYAIATRNGLLP